MKPNKVFILGIDGATFDVIFDPRLSDDLPNIREIMKNGSFGDLGSTVHPLTPQAWATFLTGMNPGKHGLFDFSKRKTDSYSLTLTNSRDRRAPTLWDYFKKSGLNTGVVNIPLTFPPPYNMNGFMLTGMHTTELRRGFTPASDFEDFIRACPGYIIDVLSNWFDTEEEFLENVHNMLKERTKAIKYLYTKYKPDCMAAVIVAADRIQHCLWKQGMDPEEIKLSSNLFKNEITGIYKKIDRAVGEIRDMLDPESLFIIVSDHGFGNLDKEVGLNRYLIECGLMRINGRKIIKTASNSLVNKIKEYNAWKGCVPGRKIDFDTVDWANTKAYSYGLFGNVCLNLEGREPQGAVRQKDFSVVLHTVSDALKNLKDGDEKVVDWVKPAGSLYKGPYTCNAPDLLICMKNYGYMTRGGYEFGSRVFYPSSIGHSGNHRMNGIFIAQGPNIRKNFRFMTAQIQDVLPTVLGYSGIPLNIDFDGRVLREIFEEYQMVSEECIHAEKETETMTLDEDEIKKRLSALGYA